MEQESITTQNDMLLHQLLATGGILPQITPIEHNPYKRHISLYGFESYIIGTNPPISYLLDDPKLVAAGIGYLRQPQGAGGRVIRQPIIPTYHGNKGSMWEYLLTPQELKEVKRLLKESGGRVKAKNYLVNKLKVLKENYADVIDSAKRKLNEKGRYDGKDDNLTTIRLNCDLMHHILSNPSAKYLLFNTASIFGNKGVCYDVTGLVDSNKNVKAFDLLIKGWQNMGLIVQIQIQSGAVHTCFPWTKINQLSMNQRRNKVAFEMKVINPITSSNTFEGTFLPGSEKTFFVVTPFSPAAVNRGKTKENAIVKAWLKNHPGQKPNDLLHLIYQAYRSKNLLLLFNLNQ